MSHAPTSSSPESENGTAANQRTPPRLKGFATFWKEFIVPFLALFGTIGAFFSLTDRFFSPSVEVLGVLPVYVRGTDNVTIDGQRESLPRRGVSFILVLQSKSREVSITELAISGRLYLTVNDWMAGHGVNGTPITALVDQMEKLRPYHEVHWIGWPESGSQGLRLRPGETFYARFTFLDPVSYTRGYSTHRDYVGMANSAVRPKQVRHYLETYEFFRRTQIEDGWRVELPVEIRKGELELILRAGRKEVHIAPSQIQPVKTVQEDQWKSKPVVELYHNRELKFPNAMTGW